MTVEQSRVTLKFRDPELEASYQEVVYPASVARLRLGTALAIVLFSSFALIDPLVSPETVERAHFIRFAIALPTFLVILGFTFTPWLGGRIQPLAFLFGLTMAGFTTVLFIRGDLVIYLYPSAYLLFFLWAFVLSAMTLTNATIFSVVMMVMYSAIVFFFNPVSLGVYAYYILVFVSAITIGFVALYVIESFSRQNFLRALEIEERSAELRKLSRATEQSPATVVVTDRDGRIEFANPKLTEVTGYGVEECLGRTPSMFQSGRHDDAFYADLWKTVLAGDEWRGEICNRRKSGELYWEHASISPIRNSSGEITHFVAVKEDITEEKAAAEALARKSLEAQLLHEASETATETSSFDEALQHILDRLCVEIGWPVGHVYHRAEEDRQLLVPTDIWHLGDKDRFRAFREVTQTMSFGPGEGLPGRVLESGEPAWIDDLVNDPNFPRAAAAAEVGLRGAFAVPIKIGAETMAVFEFFSREKIPADQDLMRIMRNVSSQTGRVLERRRTRRELEIARKAADAANVAKSAFLANMSHELRTPMNAILGYSEMLIEEAEDQELDDMTPDLKKINDAGTHLLSLINDVLDLSKIEAGKTEIYAEDFEVAGLIGQATSTAKPLIDKNGNTLEIDLADDLGDAHQDLTKLRQSLLNLLSNAAKFTDRGIVRVSARRDAREDGDWISIAVRDSGIGIPANKLDKVFEEFGQADESTTRNYGGTGLGLPISRRFCRMLGGDLTLASEPGEGSTFTIEIPAVLRQ